MALPRPEIHYEKTWQYYLKNKFKNHDFICLCYRNLTTNFLKLGWLGDSLEFYSPDIVIVQLGIVDCAPRFFISKGIFRKFLTTFPKFLKYGIISSVKRFCTRKIKYADVNLEVFDKNILQYIIRCQNLNVRQIIFIAIGNIDNTVAYKSPHFRESINNYNSILYKYVKLFPNVIVINPLSSEQEVFFCDGYHPSSIGHELIFNKILNYYNFD